MVTISIQHESSRRMWNSNIRYTPWVLLWSFQNLSNKFALFHYHFLCFICCCLISCKIINIRSVSCLKECSSSTKLGLFYRLCFHMLINHVIETRLYPDHFACWNKVAEKYSNWVCEYSLECGLVCIWQIKKCIKKHFRMAVWADEAKKSQSSNVLKLATIPERSSMLHW